MQKHSDKRDAKCMEFRNSDSHYTVAALIRGDTFFVSAMRDGEKIRLDEALQVSDGETKEHVSLLASVNHCRMDGVPSEIRNGLAPDRVANEVAFKTKLVDALATGAAVDVVSGLLRHACDLDILNDVRKRIELSVSAFGKSEWRESVITESEELLTAAQLAEKALQSNFSLSEGSKIRRMESSLGRLAQTIGEDFELYGFPKVDVSQSGDKVAFAEKCHRVANNAVFLRAGLRAGSLPATKLRKQIAYAAANREVDTVLLDIVLPVWQQRADDAKALIDRLDTTVPEAEIPLCVPEAEADRKINGGPELPATLLGLAEQEACGGKGSLAENTLLLSYVARFTSPHTTSTVMGYVFDDGSRPVTADERESAVRELDELAKMGGGLVADLNALRDFVSKRSMPAENDKQLEVAY